MSKSEALCNILYCVDFLMCGSVIPSP
jgi:hypothetical protein